jgi:beta-galactosidase
MDEEYLESGPEFNVWRAPIANDIDPWGSHVFSRNNFTPGYGRSIDNQLRTLGMRDMTSVADEISVVKVSDDEVKLKFQHSRTLPLILQ